MHEPSGSHTKHHPVGESEIRRACFCRSRATYRTRPIGDTHSQFTAAAVGSQTGRGWGFFVLRLPCSTEFPVHPGHPKCNRLIPVDFALVSNRTLAGCFCLAETEGAHVGGSEIRVASCAEKKAKPIERMCRCAFLALFLHVFFSSFLELFRFTS